VPTGPILELLRYQEAWNVTKQLMLAGVLGATLLLIGCGDQNRQTGQNSQESVPAPATAESQPPTSAAAPPAAAPTSPPVDNRLTERRPEATPRPGSAAGNSADVTPRPNPQSSAVTPAPQFREVTVATGTALPLELTTALSSETTGVEASVRARLRQPVIVNGYAALPAGTVLSGTVSDVERSGRVQGRARIAFRFTEAVIDGNREDLRTDPITFEAEATKSEDATKVGAGAGVGAVIGGILGGGKGAAKGAAIGGAAGTGAVLATRGKEVELPVGRDITARLASPLTVRVAVDAGK
jgi:hypothetical protein